MKVAGLTLAVGLLVAFCFFTRPVFDFDVWFDLRMGDTILATHQVPHQTCFLWEASALKLPYWINDEWAFSVLARLLWTWDGVRALALLVAVCMTAALACNVFAARRLHVDSWPIAIAGVAFVALVQSRLMPRPFLFTDVFLGTFALLSTCPRRTWWLFPIVLAVWRNFHAGVFAGCVFYGCLLVGDAIEWAWRRDPEKLADVKMLLWLSPLCLVALMLAPGGLGLWEYLANNFWSRTLSMQWIEEWKPIPLSNYLFWGSVVLLWGGMGYGLVLKQTHVRQVLVAVGFTCLAYRFNRSIAEYAAATMSLQALTLQMILGTWPPLEGRKVLSPTFRRVPPLALLGAVCIALIPGLRRWPREWQDPPKIDGAVAFLRKEQLPKTLFNTFHLGGMLAWQGYPDYLPFIHNITASFPDDVLYMYRDVVYGKTDGLDRFHVNVMLLGYALSPGDSTDTMLQWVEKNAHWKLVYWDDDTLIYVKDDVSPCPPAFKHVVPGDGTRWKVTDDGVFEELERAVQLAPRSVLARCWLGNACEKRGQEDRALQLYTEAEQLEPRHPLPHLCRGRLLNHQHSYEAARDELLAGWDREPPNADDAVNLAIVYYNLHDLGTAHRWLDTALRLDPNNPMAQDVSHKL